MNWMAVFSSEHVTRIMLSDGVLSVSEMHVGLFLISSNRRWQVKEGFL